MSFVAVYSAVKNDTMLYAQQRLQSDQRPSVVYTMAWFRIGDKAAFISILIQFSHEYLPIEIVYMLIFTKKYLKDYEPKFLHISVPSVIIPRNIIHILERWYIQVVHVLLYSHSTYCTHDPPMRQ